MAQARPAAMKRRDFIDNIRRDSGLISVNCAPRVSRYLDKVRRLRRDHARTVEFDKPRPQSYLFHRPPWIKNPGFGGTLLMCCCGAVVMLSSGPRLFLRCSTSYFGLPALSALQHGPVTAPAEE